MISGDLVDQARECRLWNPAELAQLEARKKA